MPGPTLTFAFIVATLYGALFHLIVGGDARRLALFLLAGWLGFAVGHMLGVTLQIDILNIGALRVFSATIGALIALIVAAALTARQPRRRLSR
ncbi:MAG: hypothetical protein DIU68_000420 [Chloroflexota bacterium]